MPQNRSPKQARRGKKAPRPLFKLDLGMDVLDVDFDPEDFDITDDSGRYKIPKGRPQRDVRILRPRLDARDVTHTVTYENAEAFARQVDLTPGARTYAWITGSFIFGDLIEALITARRVGVKKIWLCSLSFSQENVDSLKNVMLLMGPELERMTLIFSAWEYSRQKYDRIPYLYQELDDPANRVQVAFGPYHAKLIELETVTGHAISIYGSANLCSSNSIEQISVEIDNIEIHAFNTALMDRIAERFGTINAGAHYTRLKGLPQREAWQIMQEGAESSWQPMETEAPRAAETAPAAAPDAGA